MFSSWDAVTKEQRIASAADHSRVVDLDHYVVLVEADHPGWIQILQTKQEGLLNSFRRRFPSLIINGISFRLSKPPIYARPAPESIEKIFTHEKTDAVDEALLERFNDETYKNIIKILEQSLK
jgi:hypothetical protein